MDNNVLQIMGAIKQQESGGNYDASNPSGAFGAYQFMPETWNDTCNRYGLDASDTSPQNQDNVAYDLMAEYYQKYQDPKAVASMWYSGSPDYTVNSDEGNYPSVNGYVNQVMDKMGSFNFQPKDAQNNPMMTMNVNVRTSDPNEQFNSQGILGIMGKHNTNTKGMLDYSNYHNPDYNNETQFLPEDVAKYVQPTSDSLLKNRIADINDMGAQQSLSSNLNKGAQAVRLINGSNNVDNKAAYASLMKSIGINVPSNTDQYVNSNTLLDIANKQTASDMKYNLVAQKQKDAYDMQQQQLGLLQDKLNSYK